jgi:hypothetical protein
LAETDKSGDSVEYKAAKGSALAEIEISANGPGTSIEVRVTEGVG